MVPIKITNEDKILVIAPHPDDESIGCGGLLLKYAPQCEVWILADGRLAGNDNVKATIETRRKEFEQEMEFLNISKYKMFEVPDQCLYEAENLFNTENLEDYSKIFVTNSKDNHPDHALAYAIIQNSLIRKGVKVELYQYEVTTPLTGGSHYLNISDCIDKKINAISLNQSQIKLINYCQISKALASYRAETIGIRGGFIEQYLLSDYMEKDILSENEIEFLKEKERTSNFLICYHNLFTLLDEDMLFQEKEIIVYGCGKFGKMLVNVLSYRKAYNIPCIIDNYIEMDSYRGIPIKQQSDFLSEKYKSTLIIIAMIEGGGIIEKDLRKAGFSKVKLLTDILR